MQHAFLIAVNRVLWELPQSEISLLSQDRTKRITSLAGISKIWRRCRVLMGHGVPLGRMAVFLEQLVQH